MSLTLDANLQAQLDGIDRKPLAKIVSTSFASSIPFDGNSLAVYTNDHDLSADLREHSSGALTLSVYNSTDRNFRYFVTDADRLTWTEYNILCSSMSSSYPISNPAHCEMANGNIGVVGTYPLGYGYYCKYAVINSATMTYSTGGTVCTFSNYHTVYALFPIYVPNASLYHLYYTYRDYDAGPAYRLARRTSSNFTSWSAETDISPASLGTAQPYYNVHVLITSDDDIVLSFDRATIIDASGFAATQCYYMVSQDDGVTWSTPTAVTTYTGTGIAGRHPTVSEKSAGIYYCFHERSTFLTFNEDTDGVLQDCALGLHVDDVWMYNGLVYCTGSYAWSGNKDVCGMWVIDPDDMSLVTQYTKSTTPGYDADLTENEHSFSWTSYGAGKYLNRTIHETLYGDPYNVLGAVIVATYDGVTDQCNTYYFGYDSGVVHPTYGWQVNVVVEATGGIGDLVVRWSSVDEANDRIYVGLYNGYAYNQWYVIGWIDLTEAADPITGEYTWNEIFRWSDDDFCPAYDPTAVDLDYPMYWNLGRYCAESGKILMWTDLPGGYPHNIIVVDAETGVIQYYGSVNTDNNIPYNGFGHAYIYGNTIYASFKYSTTVGQESWRGLWIYDLVYRSLTISRPGYATQDQYWFTDFDFSDIANNYVWMSSIDGAVRYHTGSQTFELWNDDNVPGILSPDGYAYDHEYMSCIHYDTTSGDVYVGGSYTTQGYLGLRRFNVNGDYFKGQYAVGTKSGTSLGLGEINDLTHGNYEKDIVTVADEDDVMWAYWDHVDYSSTTRTVYWDNDQSEVNVSEDLVDVVEISHQIDTPSELRFSLANGHWYDIQNSLSARSFLFKRGRKVTVEFGEDVNGTPYWVDQGTYVVEEMKMVYKRPEHPIIEVVARTMDSLWRDARIVLSEYYDTAQPKDIVEDLVSDWTVLEGAEYTIPTFDNSHEIWHQWSDESLYDIIKDVLDHMGYAFFFTTAGVFAPKKIDFEAAVNHAYSDQTQITEYSPDTSFSNFVNKIRVIGESHDFLEVLYDAEQITTLSGTLGWWNETIVKRVYYNDERTRVCRNPYLNSIISLADFSYLIFKGGGKEYISDEDPAETWVEITLEGPNLIPVVVGLAIAVVALGITASYCFLACGPFIFATNVMISLLCYALLATATYDIEVWAHPIGEQKQTIQYVATDQAGMNVINQQEVVEEIEDALCYTVGDCQRVAEFELNVLKYQRERIRLTKLAHLQDELLDMVTVKHPYSSQTMQVMIASLKRTLVIRREMLDSIEGWRIA